MKYPIFLFLQLLSINGFTQSWNSFGEFSSSVRTIFSDSTDNKLYIGGHFATINNSTYNGIAIIDTLGILPMGTGQDVSCNPFNCSAILDIHRYNNEIWSTTATSPFDGVETGGLIKWDGNSWNSFESNFYNLNNNLAIIRNLEVLENELYILGGISYVDSDTIRGIVKWDGDNISSLNFPFPFDFSFYDLSSAVIFQNELYVAGNILLNDGVNTIHDILKYNGDTWEQVGEGLVGNNTIIGDMEVYKDELYVAGLIYQSEGNLGDGILKFDGENWSDVGGSFNHDALVFDLLIHNDELYAFGNFNFVGNIPVDNMAKWDGERWCSFPFTFDNRIFSADVHNGDLIIGGAFKKINSDSVSSLAIFNGDLKTDFCDTIIVNTSSTHNYDKYSIDTYPNPTSNYLNITITNKYSKEKSTLTIHNSLGQILSQQLIPIFEKEWTHQLDVSSFPSGTYFLTLQNGDGIVSRKFMVQR